MSVKVIGALLRLRAKHARLGLSPVPCPTNCLSRQNGDWFVSDLFWERGGLERRTWALRERIGFVWVWLRGKTPDAKKASPL